MSPTVTFKDIILNFINKYFSYLRGKSIEYPNVTKSLILHLLIVVTLSGTVPTCSKKIEAPRIIAVDIMPLGQDQKTAPKPLVEQKKPVEKKEPPKPVPPKEIKKPADAAKMEKADKPKPIAKPQEKPSPKKVEKKPEPEKKKVEEQKKDTQDQEGKKKLLKDLEKKEQAALDDIFAEASKEPTPPAVAQASGKAEPTVDPAFVNELMGKIQSQVSQCWNIPIGAKDVQNMRVNLFIALAANGGVTQVKIIDQIQYNTDNVYRVVADSAVWAVKECSPLQGLPADKYDLWKEIEFSFDPSMAL